MVLNIEQSVGINERIKQKKKYSHSLLNSEKAFVVRWKQTEKERLKMISRKEILRKQVIKVPYQTSIAESNSTEV